MILHTDVQRIVKTGLNEGSVHLWEAILIHLLVIIGLYSVLYKFQSKFDHEPNNKTITAVLHQWPKQLIQHLVGSSCNNLFGSTIQFDYNNNTWDDSNKCGQTRIGVLYQPSQHWNHVYYPCNQYNSSDNEMNGGFHSLLCHPLSGIE